MSSLLNQGFGWIPDLPDPRDFTYQHKDVKSLLRKLGAFKAEKHTREVDLCCGDEGEVFITDARNQWPLNSSTAFAVLGLVEYFERRVHGQTFEGSTLFLYKMTRKLRHSVGDCGADLRTTLKTLRRFGVPPAELWHNDPAKFDDEPLDACLIGYARAFQDICYVRLDARDAKSYKNRDLSYALGSQTLRIVKSFLTAGFPVVFGFPVPKSLNVESRIPFRPNFDSVRGGQAVLAVGYDDRKDTSPKGAIRIRSSWGQRWGDAGYGWLPYAFFEQRLAKDCWTLLRPDWIDPKEFSVPSILVSGAAGKRGAKST